MGLLALVAPGFPKEGEPGVVLFQGVSARPRRRTYSAIA